MSKKDDKKYQEKIEKASEQLGEVKEKLGPATQSAYDKVMEVGASITGSESEAIGQPTPFAQSRKEAAKK